MSKKKSLMEMNDEDFTFELREILLQAAEILRETEHNELADKLLLSGGRILGMYFKGKARK